MDEKLQKIIAQAGLASRRKAERLIARGIVTVNGKVATIGDRATAGLDDIRINDKPLHELQDNLRYIVMHKRWGVLSSTQDFYGRPTVIGELGEAVPERVFPAGRLDMDSQGLIFLTNDGWMANRIMHPRYGCNKTYKVLIGGVPSEHALERWRSGENLYMDGQPLAPCGVEILEVMDDRTWLIVILGEGKKRQIRRTAEIFRHTVIELIRTHIGPIELGDLPYGAWRDLTPEEVETLRENFLKVSDPDEEDSMPEIAVNLEDDDESQ